MWLNVLSAHTQAQPAPQEGTRGGGAAAEAVLPARSGRNAAPCRAPRAALLVCIPLQIAPRTFSWEENQKTPVTVGSWCLNSKQTDQGSCIPAYQMYRLGKFCLGIKKWCLKEKKKNEWWFWGLNGLGSLWICYLGIFREADGHIPELFFFPLTHQLNTLKWWMCNWSKLSSLVELKYKQISKGFSWNYR